MQPEKSYLYIEDCIDAMSLASKESRKKDVDIYNIGSEDCLTVKEIARILCKNLGSKPEFKFTGGKRGWKCDVPLMRLDIRKIKSLGWTPKYNSGKSVATVIEKLGRTEYDKEDVR